MEKNNKLRIHRLNRTMQYGNGGLTKEKNNQKIKFKSYYVVWKLFFGHFSIKRENGLNRTMQYGNCMRIDNIVNLQEV